MTYNVTEQYVLDNLDKIDSQIIEEVFFPQFQAELEVTTVPVVIAPSHYGAVYHRQLPTFEEWQAAHYAQLRQYPSVTEQLDYIYHHGLEAWKTEVIDPVKAAVPKP